MGATFFESLRFQRKELSPLELVKQLDWHRRFCMDMLETERKRNIEASLLNAEQVCYTRSPTRVKRDPKPGQNPKFLHIGPEKIRRLPVSECS